MVVHNKGLAEDSFKKKTSLNRNFFKKKFHCTFSIVYASTQTHSTTRNVNKSISILPQLLNTLNFMCVLLILKCPNFMLLIAWTRYYQVTCAHSSRYFIDFICSYRLFLTVTSFFKTCSILFRKVVINTTTQNLYDF